MNPFLSDIMVGISGSSTSLNYISLLLGFGNTEIQMTIQRSSVGQLIVAIYYLGSLSSWSSLWSPPHPPCWQHTSNLQCLVRLSPAVDCSPSHWWLQWQDDIGDDLDQGSMIMVMALRRWWCWWLFAMKIKCLKLITRKRSWWSFHYLPALDPPHPIWKMKFREFLFYFQPSLKFTVTDNQLRSQRNQLPRKRSQGKRGCWGPTSGWMACRGCRCR